MVRSRIDFPFRGKSGRAADITAMTESDPGCVKTLEAIVGAQQKNRSHSLDESFMRGRPSLCTNLVPERPIEWFSHSQDPKRTLMLQNHLSECSLSVCSLPRYDALS